MFLHYITNTMNNVERPSPQNQQKPLTYIEGRYGDLWIMAGTRPVMYMRKSGTVEFPHDIVGFSSCVLETQTKDETTTETASTCVQRNL